MFPYEILALAVLFAVNRLVTPRVLTIPAAFFLINALDLIAAIWIYSRGLPGLEDSWAVRLLVGTLLLFHIVQNLALRARAREKQADTAERRRAQFRQVNGQDPTDP